MGNPGAEYENTRHNVGFWFVDYLAHKFQFADFSRSGPCLCTEGCHGDLKLLLVKPILYMNRSGLALTGLWRQRPFLTENLLVCYDDLALPAGKIRLRGRGTAGGHKGMASILEALGTEQCARLRFGVGNENIPPDRSQFVLEPFAREEEDAVLDRFEDAAAAVLAALTEGIEKAMGRYNG